jgi:hypothetical protein
MGRERETGNGTNTKREKGWEKGGIERGGGGIEEGGTKGKRGRERGGGGGEIEREWV